MNIDNFENYINSVILSRGLDYFRSGNVIGIDKIDGNTYEAEVSGTDDYFVSVELNDDKDIIHSECDCPYDGGPYCKHEAAVFYALRNMHKANPCAAAGRGKVIDLKPENLEKLLLNQSKEKLVKFILTLAAEREDVNLKIRLEFDSANYENRLRDCIELIRYSVDQHSDSHGFVRYSEVPGAMKGAEQVMEMAENAADDENYLRAVDLFLCVIRELVPLLQNADDSMGYISSAIDSCISSIDNISEEELEEDLQRELFQKLLKESEDKIYEDWDDWRMGLLGSCITLASTQSSLSALEAQLETLVEGLDESWSSKYLYERIMNLRLSLILIHYGDEAADDFINQNLNIPSFRKRAINRAISLEQYELAEKLALEGEEINQNLAGLVNDFRELRYEIYRLSNQLEKQRKLSMEFILQGSFEYYKKLKDTYDNEEWLSIYPGIIIKLSPDRGYKQNYTEILIEEEEFSKLLEYVRTNPGYILSYYEYLLEDYPNEVYKLFEIYILEEAQRASYRDAYRKVADTVKLLAKAGGRNEAKNIVEKLLTLYPRRPAFREELMKIKT